MDEEIFSFELKEIEKDLSEATTEIRADLLLKIYRIIPRRTKWIERKDGTFGCSHCWFTIPIEYAKDFNFCPKCSWIIER